MFFPPSPLNSFRRSVLLFHLRGVQPLFVEDLCSGITSRGLYYMSGSIRLKCLHARRLVTTQFISSRDASVRVASSTLFILALPGDTYSSPQDLRISLLRWSEVFTKKLNRVIVYISSFFILLHRLVNVFIYISFSMFHSYRLVNALVGVLPPFFRLAMSTNH